MTQTVHSTRGVSGGTLQEVSSSRTAKSSGFGGRVPRGVIVVVVIGLAALIGTAMVLKQATTGTSVATLSADVSAGTTITEDMIAWTDVRLGSTANVIEEGDIDDVIGKVPTGPLATGDIIHRSQLVEAIRPGSTHMAIPIAPLHAAGGSLVAGDTIDIIGLKNGAASYFARNVAVVNVVAPPESLNRVGADQYAITVEVASEDALEIATALNDSSGGLELVKSTGAQAGGGQ